MECGPATSDEVENVAWPDELIVTVDNTVEPSLKTIVPVGVPAPGAIALTLAVKVTELFSTDGFAEEAIPTVVEATLTV